MARLFAVVFTLCAIGCVLAAPGGVGWLGALLFGGLAGLCESQVDSGPPKSNGPP